MIILLYFQIESDSFFILFRQTQQTMDIDRSFQAFTFSVYPFKERIEVYIHRLQPHKFYHCSLNYDNMPKELKNQAQNISDIYEFLQITKDIKFQDSTLFLKIFVLLKQKQVKIPLKQPFEIPIKLYQKKVSPLKIQIQMLKIDLKQTQQRQLQLSEQLMKKKYQIQVLQHDFELMKRQNLELKNKVRQQGVKLKGQMIKTSRMMVQLAAKDEKILNFQSKIRQLRDNFWQQKKRMIDEELLKKDLTIEQKNIIIEQAEDSYKLLKSYRSLQSKAKECQSKLQKQLQARFHCTQCRSRFRKIRYYLLLITRQIIDQVPTYSSTWPRATNDLQHMTTRHSTLLLSYKVIFSVIISPIKGLKFIN